MKPHIFITLSLLACITTSESACTKFLNAKPDKKLAVPSSISDIQALLDNWSRVNTKGCPAPIMSSDNFYFDEAGWAKLNDSNQKMYLWQRNAVFPQGLNPWSDLYTVVYYANTAIEGVPKFTRNDENAAAWDNALGEGYFLRANAFLEAAGTWSQAYDEATAENDLGIPLRLSTDFNEPSTRPSLGKTYDQIIADLKSAIALLPVTQSHSYRPDKPAAYGLLARTYLYMRDYQQALSYSDSSLRLDHDLLDYNDLDSARSYPIPENNEEILFNESCAAYSGFFGYVDSSVYRSYDDLDLRKKLFFKPTGSGPVSFRGSYYQSTLSFIGVTTSEEYLIRAECEARTGQTEAAMNDLNTLLATRWQAGTFVPYTAVSSEEALGIILQERRKELLFRGTRWMDIKRLNKEGAKITLTREINGQTYTLQPNTPPYALPIPDDIIQLSGMPQNPD